MDSFVFLFLCVWIACGTVVYLVGEIRCLVRGSSWFLEMKIEMQKRFPLEAESWVDRSICFQVFRIVIFWPFWVRRVLV